MIEVDGPHGKYCKKALDLLSLASKANRELLDEDEEDEPEPAATQTQDLWWFIKDSGNDYINGPDVWREFIGKLPEEIELHWWNLMSDYQWLDFYTKTERDNFIEEIAVNDQWATFAKEYGNVFCW